MSSIIMYKVNRSEQEFVENKFKRICSNIRKFNGSACQYKTSKGISSKTFTVSNHGVKVMEITLEKTISNYIITRTKL